MDLTDRQWKLISDLFATYIKESAGRPPLPCRQVLDGIFWKIRTGASWDDLPEEYPSHQTCYRYFNKWIKDGTLDQALNLLNADLKSHGLDINKAIQSSEIRFLPVPPKLLILLPPRLVDTWKGSTALLRLQVLLTDMRKNGSYPKKVEQVYTSTLDALKLFNAETDETHQNPGK
jgi:transposase